MKTIICPVDFSDISENAASYALRLARQLNGEVVLAHAQHVPVVDTNAAVTGLKDIMEERQLEVSKQLDELAGRLKSSVGGNVRTWQSFGLVVDMINEIKKETEVYMVVMGTKGATNQIDRWVGTTSSDVMARCDLPLMIIPYGCSYEGWKKVGYATDFSQESDNTLLDFQEFVKPFGSEMYIVHVSGKKVDAEEMMAVIRHFEDARVETIDGDDIAVELNDYVWAKDLQLLALKRHKRSFFEKLFHKSVSRELAISSDMPILIL